MSEMFFSGEYRRICERTRVDEPASRYPDSARMPVAERFVRCFWFDQNLTTNDLRTIDGRKLRVLSPGWWNLEAGPDFRNAVIRLANEPIIKGDVEIHVDASGWNAHGHQHDHAYDGVVLHVVLRNDQERETVKNASGAEIPQLVLEPYLAGGLADLVETVNPEDYPESAECSAGPCSAALREKAADDRWLGLFLDFAGDQRAISRMKRWEHLCDSIGREAAIQAGVMEALGFKKNKSQFSLLARLAPPVRLLPLLAAEQAPSAKRLCVEAVLFGLSGLLDLPMKNELDDEADVYMSELRERWQAYRSHFDSEPMDGKQWQFSGSRPFNFPTRRIGAAAAFLADNLEAGLFNTLLTCLPPHGNRLRQKDVTTARKNLEVLFTELEGGFWHHRCTFDGKRSANPMGLVGTDRAALIIVNVIVPVLLLHARRTKDTDLEQLLHWMYAKLPRLQETSVETFMVQRIFGGDEQAAKVISNTRRQQGIYQVFKDFCEKDDRGCRRCALLAELDRL